MCVIYIYVTLDLSNVILQKLTKLCGHNLKRALPLNIHFRYNIQILCKTGSA